MWHNTVRTTLPSFLLLLKTSEVFWCFHGVEKRCIANKWVKKNSCINMISSDLIYKWNSALKITERRFVETWGRKIKDENGQNTVINLTTETNRTLTDQKACLDKCFLNFLMLSFWNSLEQSGIRVPLYILPRRPPFP